MKKVLIVTYYWPPAGGPGVQRVLNMVKHLPEYGWQPMVLTVEKPSAPAIDPSLLNYIPKECKVYKTRTSEPFEAYKKLTGKKSGEALPKNITLDTHLSFSEKLSRWIRANLFIPDARKGWKRFLVREGMKIIKSEKPDLILSTSPPHSVQVAAMKLAKKSELPWVVDLRDPWTEAYWESAMPKTQSSENKNKRFERDVLNTADQVTTVGEGVAKLLRGKTTKPVSVIYNGYRKVDNGMIKSDYFEILHLGNLSTMQSIEELLLAIEMLDKEIQKNIKLRFIGSLASEHKERIDHMEFVLKEYLPFMPYENMIKEAKSASLLFLPRLNSTYSKSLISAKIFDYLALGRPIFAIADKDSDVSGILKHSESGLAFESYEINKMVNYLKNCYDHLKDYSINTTKLKTYSLEENISSLSDIFNRLIS